MEIRKQMIKAKSTSYDLDKQCYIYDSLPGKS